MRPGPPKGRFRAFQSASKAQHTPDRHGRSKSNPLHFRVFVAAPCRGSYHTWFALVVWFILLLLWDRAIPNEMECFEKFFS